jgi:hypothetical protein
MVQLSWTEAQKIIVIRIISFTATAMSDDKRGAALALIHTITFASKDELNRRMDDIRVYVSDETLARLEDEK